MEESITFAEMVFKCAENKSLVSEFDRLTGSDLSMKGTALDRMIDSASGKTDSDIEAFIGFVHEFIWAPLTGIK